MSYGIHYHKVSPNPATQKCLVTDEVEDGVVVLNDRVEPPFQPFLFIGRTAIVEMVAQTWGLKPNDVRDLLNGAPMLQAEAKYQKDLAKYWESQYNRVVKRVKSAVDKAFAEPPESAPEPPVVED